MLYAVIMAGGVGTRFWPASRAARPKQLLSFGTGRSMVEETLDRVADLVPPERILVMTNAGTKRVMHDLLPEVPEANVFGEPTNRDTSACIGLAASVVLKRDSEAVMAVLPADHLIRPKELFCSSLTAAADFLKTHPGTLVTFGIEPKAPATGYGYVKRGEELARGGGITFFNVEKFHEKPDAAKAGALLAEGGFYWNSGVFVWRADTILERIGQHLPALHNRLGLLAEKIDDDGFGPLFEKIYPTLEKVSIDFGVLEKTQDRTVAAVNYYWDDVGSWSALDRLIETDDAGNRVQGTFRGENAKNLIVSARGGMVAAIGVEGLIIVHTPDATLVCRKEDAESVKKLVDGLDGSYR
jgi:mannose-1-phosphate guanylyltransferase